MTLFDGTFPSARHDGSPWLASDAARAALAGAPKSTRAALVLLKGGRSSASGSGSPPGTQASGLASAALPPLRDFAAAKRANPNLPPWHVNNDDDDAGAATRREVTVTVDRPGRTLLCSLRRYDKRQRVTHGEP